MKKIIMFLSKIFFIYCFSGGLYIMIETLFRGYSFMEMYYLGGALGVMAYFLNNIFSYDMDFLLQCLSCTAVGTYTEGLLGNIINTDYYIWDYRDLPLSLWNDQINIIFIGLWFVLFMIGIPILDYIGWKCFGEKKPYYIILGYRIQLFGEV